MQIYRDKEACIDDRIEDLLARMTLEEKTAQLTQFFGRNAYVLKEDGIGLRDVCVQQLSGAGIGLLYGVQRADTVANVKENENLTPEQAAKLVNAIQRTNMENTRLAIPLLFAEECSHGLMAFDTVVYPVPLCMGSMFDEELYGRICRAIATEARARGVMITYSPVLEVLRDPRWGRAEETYGEDVYLCTRMGLRAIREFANGRIAADSSIVAAVKHFVVHGCPEGGINVAYTSVGERQLQEVWLYPFQQAVRAGAKAMITSYHEIDGVPVCCNKELVRETVKDRWGFKGFIFSDLGAVELLKDVYGITNDYKEATFMAFDAGIDIDMLGVLYHQYLAALIREGRITEAELDDSVARILRLKFEMGLFENPYVDEKRAEARSRMPEHIALARQAAREGIVMLKNRGGLLPLDKGLSVAVVGPNADDVYNQLGDYTAWQKRENVVTVLDGIRRVAKRVHYAKGCAVRGPSTEGFGQALEAAAESDVIIAAVGGSANRFMGTGNVDPTTGQAKIVGAEISDMETGEGVDRMSLELLGPQKELLMALKKTGKPLVVVYISGRPIADPWVDENADAILQAWFPGEQGGNAIADIVFGACSPSGKLTVSIPKHVGQIPLYYNRRPSVKRQIGYVEMDAEPAYPFGFGLSFTDFAYSDLTIDRALSTVQEQVTIAFTIRNVGRVAGAEVAQIYIKDLCASVTRPDMELKGFVRVMLEPNESKRVEWVLKQEDLEIYDIHKQWVVEPGEFAVMVGASSKDIRLRGTFVKQTSSGPSACAAPGKSVSP